MDTRTVSPTGGTLTLLIAGLLVTTMSIGPSGQVPRGTLLESGLHSFPARHTARVTVAEIGPRLAVSRVAIELRDAEDTVVARASGVLRRGKAVRLDFQVPESVQLRASVAFVGARGASSRPTTTVEDIDVDAFRVVPKVVCGPPSGRSDPQFSCPGWEVTDFVP